VKSKFVPGGERTKLLEVEMLDGSVFKMPDKYWQKAFDIKYGNYREQAIDAFREITKKHFEEKTVPTRFGWNEPWPKKDAYKSHAELGVDVMYVYIRAALLAIVMAELTPEGQPKPKVIALGKDGAIEYTDEGKRQLEEDEIF